jgi:hypothetical protein
MARIAFILLCHKNPEAIIRQAGQLTAAGDFIAIHFDARSSAEDDRRIRAALAGNPAVTFARRRVKCGWGEWSLVAATLEAVRAALTAFPDATHFYMLSGDCMAIKSAVYADRKLAAEDCDYIESFDFFESGWIKTGMVEERLIYRHWFNERTQERLYHASLWVQQKLGMKRAIPADLRIMIGSQWWCLRRRTVEAVLGFIAKRPDVVDFFRWTWIPDETFFQTLVRHLVPASEIRSRTLTFLMFTDYGMPVTFYNDHYDLLIGQDHLFARKISPEALQLKERLGDLYASGRTDFAASDEGRRLFGFLTGRGRIGRRFAPRFWESEVTAGGRRELLILVCKKWHVAKRLAAAIRAGTGLPCLDYVFDEESADLPDLGGIESSLAKRTRHRRALVRMLFDALGTERMLVCVDPAGLDLIRDFYGDRAMTRMLQILCDFPDDYLAGHAHRVGLVGAETSAATLKRLLPTVRYDLQQEADRIRDERFAHYHELRTGAPAAEIAQVLAAFLDLGPVKARQLAATPGLLKE